MSGRTTRTSKEAAEAAGKASGTALDAPDDWLGLSRLPPAHAFAVSCSGIGPIAEVGEVGVLVEGPAVSGSVVVDLAVTRSALGASCRSEGRWARSRVRGKRVDGRVCSVTVAAGRLKEVWLCDPEGIRRPDLQNPTLAFICMQSKENCHVLVSQ